MSTPSLQTPAAVEVPAGPLPAALFTDPYGRETIRAELFGPEHLEAHARRLAAASAVAPHSTGRALLRRFAQNGQVLVHAHRRIAEASQRQESLSADAEWLLDNFHIVTEALREIRDDLPRSYQAELPKLAGGPLAGFPRVYALAVNLLAHTDSSLDETNVTRFVQAYQTVGPLAIGELWAVPIMLRLALLENLRRLAEQMLQGWHDRRQADAWAARLCELVGARAAAAPERRPESVWDLTLAAPHPALEGLGGPLPAMPDAFVVHLLQGLRSYGPAAAPGVTWLEGRLAERGTTAAEVRRREHQRQAANQVSVGNCVTSLRLLSALDWTVFFERTSLVEAILRDDPAGVYPRQDFATRDRYRRQVEKLARGAGLSELQVARRAIVLARQGKEREADARARQTAGGDGGVLSPELLNPERRGHIGYYLVDGGRKELEADLGYRPGPGDRLLRAALDHPQAVYFGAIAGLTALVLAGLLAGGGLTAGNAWWLLPVLVLLLVLPASEVAVGLVNYLVTLFLPPRVLPRLDFKDGIPADCAAFVVMPSMLLRPQSAETLLERLEVHYLSNPDANLYFALLTDFADGPAEHMPEDEGYLRDALERVRALNERYRGKGPDRFYLFHRRRLWNPVQGCWMGWERKRGKLREFNRLLRGARDTSFTTRSGDPDRLPAVRYVITLDADTQLPRETAQRLVATLAHPLNRARFDPQQGRVTEGYGILQPRVSLRLLAATRSLFARIFAGSAGIDPYTTAVSDVYQDLFGVGSFTGKGIYDIDAFEAATGHTFPDNHILSHDLIEGNYARCALATDIELLDDFPARYHVYARRAHRWARGDWQILPWLFPSVPCPSSVVRGPLPFLRSPTRLAHGRRRTTDHGRRTNPLPALERWKVLDNLRRSLVPPALVLLLVLGWTVLAGAWFWTGVVLAVLALPLLLQCGGVLFDLARAKSALPRLRDLRAEAPCTAGQVLLSATLLADQAWRMLDAVVRTLVRLTVTRRNLLEWETAATTERRLGTGFVGFCATMWPAPVLAVAVAAALGLGWPRALPAAGPFLALWLVSPLVAFWVSRPRAAREVPPLSADERRRLRRVARKTWHFFETFVTDADHWLPPDNFQEDPKGQVAHRTSPTNQGLLLLSTLAAHDLGYLGLPALVERLERTLDTLDRLERYHGHFHNWYDTRTLQSLQPVYISTVDSGNLLGCLVTLKQGLREKVEEPIPGPALRDGLADTLELVAENLRALTPPAGGRPNADGAGAEGRADAAEDYPEFQNLDVTVQALRGLLAEAPGDLLAWDDWLGRLEERAAPLPGQVEALAEVLDLTPEDLQRWSLRLVELARGRREELARVAPWARLLSTEFPVLSTQSEVLPRWQAVCRILATPASVASIQAQAESVPAELEALAERVEKAEVREALTRLAAAVRASGAAELQARCQRLADRAAALGREMGFKFLYNGQRQLFSTGLNLSAGRLDNSHYDLLASEARLASFLAIARGEADRKHWFQLGRLLTRAAGSNVLVSWGGTMFEYLMPQLLLRSYPNTLLDESHKGAVARHIEYGRQAGVPWGISESAYSAVDGALWYQYQSFGVPGLGLKRGLAQELVIAPYATALAAMVDPRAALANFRRLAAEGGEGPYGFYEAIDYTRDRLAKKRRSLVVRCYMAHHQGMSLVALANCLLGNPMPRRFHAEAMVRATELLLQERIPRAVPLVEPHRDEVDAAQPPHRDEQHPMSRKLTTAQTPAPRTHLLSNGHYTVMLTNAGGGFSTWRGLDVTRWREDRSRDACGQFCYVRDLRSGLVWSAGHQPVGRAADHYEVVYSADKAEFRRLDAGIETHLEVTVSPENAAEVRRVTLTNHTARAHDLEVTSYAELVLGHHPGDLAHPAFGKLFLETEFLPAAEALLCRRRPRAADQKPVWAVHVLAVDGPTVGRLQYETDRGRFLGRGRTPADPAALDPLTPAALASGETGRGEGRLSGRTGPVLDPVFSLRRRVRVVPGAAVSVAFTTAVAESHAEALALADQYHDVHAVTRAFELAWAHSQLELRHLRLSPETAHLYQRLAAHVLYAGPTLRAGPAVLAANRQGQMGLWRHGISGDRPIVLARLAEEEELPLAQQLLVAHGYWRFRGLEVDLVLLNEHPTSYFEEFHQKLLGLVRSSDAHDLIDRPGGVFLRKAAHISDEDRTLLQAAARVVLVGNRGTLASQIDRVDRPAALPARLVPTEESADAARGAGGDDRPPPPDLLYANGVGGFSPDGREYVLRVGATTGPGVAGAARAAGPPNPWSNVIANPSFGFLVSERGAGYTWAGNSQTNRLTPWSNDPVSDPAGEIVYLRDEGSGDFWRVPHPWSAAPARVRCRHGQGYTVFEQHSHGLAQELLLFVPPEDPVKLIRLTVRNEGGRPRRLSATFYAEWVLGTVRDQAAMNVVCAVDADSGALLARNAFNADFGSRVAFADVNLRPHTVTADRTEFLGRNGSPAAPAALGRVELSGRAEPGLDPCAAVQGRFELAPGESREVVFLLGEAAHGEEVQRLLERYRDPGQVQAAFDAVRERWERVLTAVQVRTPNTALDLMLNRWLVYQTLSCRVWGRSAFYQSGGAYGFRDQLQDVMALVYGAPAEARAHILRAAARQFREGDVQHWWHPPAGKGVRTRISDDFLWLPFVVCHYVTTTGDAAVLDERVPFLEAPRLKPEQEEDYGQPHVSEETGTVYEHCVRAIENGLRFGAHGLPLMGTGDWNDGMNRVGAHGKGESVWDGWFLLTILRHFLPLAAARDNTARAERYRAQAEALRAALEEHAWDGRWYRRAWFDDGTLLGSATNDECRIDSIAQTWAVLSGAADPERARQALAAVDEHLVRRSDRMILLFTPPFDQGALQPGYIKGYVPGIRENGGQYTHAATWVAQAAALLGQGARALEYFDLLNPVHHAATPEAVERYRVEPYVVVADVYSEPPHTGRGGWTWYTGSAGWLYRVGLESILGFHLHGDRLVVDPCIPGGWPQFEITYRHRSATYHITVENPHGVERGVRRVEVDGAEQPDGAVPLADDGRGHAVRVVLG